MEDDQNVVVQTNRGPVRGRKRLTVNQESYYSFQGIPYAKPPVAELRFKVRRICLNMIIIIIYLYSTHTILGTK